MCSFWGEGAGNPPTPPSAGCTCTGASLVALFGARGSVSTRDSLPLEGPGLRVVLFSCVSFFPVSPVCCSGQLFGQLKRRIPPSLRGLPGQLFQFTLGEGPDLPPGPVVIIFVRLSSDNSTSQPSSRPTVPLLARPLPPRSTRLPLVRVDRGCHPFQLTHPLPRGCGPIHSLILLFTSPVKSFKVSGTAITCGSLLNTRASGCSTPVTVLRYGFTPLIGSSRRASPLR